MSITAELHDGRRLEFPDGIDPAIIQATVKKILGTTQAPQANPFGPTADEGAQWGARVAQNVGNLAAGGVRGAGSIGATALAPVDVAKDALAGKGVTLESNRERRAAMDAALANMGADPNSLSYKAGKLAAEVAGTAGTGQVLANGARAIPVLANNAPRLIN